MPSPVTVGYITKDVRGLICNDTCHWALDGICDDGSVTPPVMRWYHKRHMTSGCALGTDCTDCGGVDALIRQKYPHISTHLVVNCTNTCKLLPFDNVCDDPRGTGNCDLGTDCADCGPAIEPLKVNNTEPIGFVPIFSLTFLLLMSISGVFMFNKWQRHHRKETYNRYVRLMQQENGESEI